MISERQLEAYKLVYIERLSKREAAQRMGCSRQGIDNLLFCLKKNYPSAFPKKGKKSATKKKMLSYLSTMDYDIKIKF